MNCLKEINVDLLLNESVSKGLDPDKYSKVLKEYHRCLWSHRKIDGKSFTLVDDGHNKLKYSTDNLEIVFTPDSITNSFIQSGRRIKKDGEITTEGELIAKFRQEDGEIDNLLNEYEKEDYKIGTSIIFPISINGTSIRWTLNIARGILHRVHDRIDLTLECIRRYYQEPDAYNPLRNSINRNLEFFKLFKSFEEYIDFFFLKCLIDKDGKVKGLSDTLDFFEPFPLTREQYKTYLKNTLAFMEDRKRDIGDWIKNGN